MKHIFLLVIRAYWFIVPMQYRRKCIFRISCSRHIYQQFKDHGLASGLKALSFRYKYCRNNYRIFINPVHGKPTMLIGYHILLEQDEISERLLLSLKQNYSNNGNNTECNSIFLAENNTI
jgi:putative component of membrane protein insertase Oxa1/YidC/SpoIIIJ protein YidD